MELMEEWVGARTRLAVDLGALRRRLEFAD